MSAIKVHLYGNQSDAAKRKKFLEECPWSRGLEAGENEEGCRRGSPSRSDTGKGRQGQVWGPGLGGLQETVEFLFRLFLYFFSLSEIEIQEGEGVRVLRKENIISKELEREWTWIT